MTEYRILFIDDAGEIEDVDHTSYPNGAVKQFADSNRIVIETTGGRTVWSNVPEYPVEPSPKLPLTHNPIPQDTDSFTYNDGGREAAGYKGYTGDCVTRAVAIATGQDYKTVYDAMAEINANERIAKRGRRTARSGIYTKRKQFKDYMTALGWVFVPTMFIGSGCKVHVKADELPAGHLILALSKHYAAFIDGVLHDTYDSSREGTRCVYGYYKKV